MTVYVDELKIWPHARPPFHRGSCHLTADSLEELHAFAAKIGLKRAWFQTPDCVPHYDLTPSRRVYAIGHGAIETTARTQAIERRKKTRIALDLHGLEDVPLIDLDPKSPGDPTATNVVNLHEGADALLSVLRTSAFGGPRDRAYLGQGHTWWGARGKLPVKNRTYRDVGDAVAEEIAHAAKTYALEVAKIDEHAIAQNVLRRLEVNDGHDPAYDATTLDDYGTCPTCDQPWKPGANGAWSPEEEGTKRDG